MFLYIAKMSKNRFLFKVKFFLFIYIYRLYNKDKNTYYIIYKVCKAEGLNLTGYYA